MGHDDMRAALSYQHATAEADQITERLSKLVDEHRDKAGDNDYDGTHSGVRQWK